MKKVLVNKKALETVVKFFLNDIDGGGADLPKEIVLALCKLRFPERQFGIRDEESGHGNWGQWILADAFDTATLENAADLWRDHNSQHGERSPFQLPELDDHTVWLCQGENGDVAELRPVPNASGYHRLSVYHGILTDDDDAVVDCDKRGCSYRDNPFFLECVLRARGFTPLRPVAGYGLGRLGRGGVGH